MNEISSNDSRSIMKAYMALSCKVGAHERVLEEIKRMNMVARTLNEPEPEVFLLFGPFDILVQFRELRDLEDFVNKWFTPIRMIMPDDPLVEKTQTWLVISESGPCAEEPYAFLFINTQPRNLEKVQQGLKDIPEVLCADTVFGPYDVVCAVRAKDKLDLQNVISKIQRQIPFVMGTMTQIVASSVKVP